MTSPQVAPTKPRLDAQRESVCCWCEPERVAALEQAHAQAARFGICRSCLEPRLRALRGLRESRVDSHAHGRRESRTESHVRGLRESRTDSHVRVVS